MADSQTVNADAFLRKGERGWKKNTILYIIDTKGTEKPHKEFANPKEIASKWIGRKRRN